MEAKARFISGWNNALSAARFTVGKATDQNREPSEQWKRQMCISEHSPLREVVYRVECYGMPRRAMQHLVRHHDGIEKYVATSRPDRNPFADHNVVNVAFTINAQALIVISRVRLCRKAWSETITAWEEILDAVKLVDPIIVEYCVPNCEYRGICPEKDCCGYRSSQQYKMNRDRYEKQSIPLWGTSSAK